MGDFGVKAMILRFSKYACVGQLKGAKAYEYRGSERSLIILKITPKKFERCKLAEKEGFEPSIQVLPVCSLSRGVPSTSRPFLRQEADNTWVYIWRQANDSRQIVTSLTIGDNGKIYLLTACSAKMPPIHLKKLAFI